MGKEQLFMEKYAGRDTLELNLADRVQVCSHLGKRSPAEREARVKCCDSFEVYLLRDKREVTTAGT